MLTRGTAQRKDDARAILGNLSNTNGVESFKTAPMNTTITPKKAATERGPQCSPLRNAPVKEMKPVDEETTTEDDSLSTSVAKMAKLIKSLKCQTYVSDEMLTYVLDSSLKILRKEFCFLRTEHRRLRDKLAKEISKNKDYDKVVAASDAREVENRELKKMICKLEKENEMYKTKEMRLKSDLREMADKIRDMDKVMMKGCSDC